MIKTLKIYVNGIICEIIPKVDVSLRYEILDLVVNQSFSSLRPDSAPEMV